MINLPVIASALAFVALSFSAITQMNTQALLARPPVDLSRLVFCAALLSEPSRSTQPAANFPKEPVLLGEFPAARVFTGRLDEADASTVELLNEARTHSRLDVEIVGDQKIRAAFRRATDEARPTSFDGEDPPLVSHLQAYADYQTSRYASEVADFKKVLADYAEGENLDVVVLAVSEVEPDLIFSTFAMDALTRGWRARSTPRDYVWHLLAYDPDLRKPVWRAGLAKF